MQDFLHLIDIEKELLSVAHGGCVQYVQKRVENFLQFHDENF